MSRFTVPSASAIDHVAGARDQHHLGHRQLARELLGEPGRGEAVLAAGHDQRRGAEVGEAPRRSAAAQAA